MLEGLGDEELGRLFAGSTRITCSKGDALIRKDQLTRTLYVVLSGTLEARACPEIPTSRSTRS